MATVEASNTWKASQQSMHDIGLSAPCDPLEGSCGAECLLTALIRTFRISLLFIIVLVQACSHLILHCTALWSTTLPFGGFQKTAFFFLQRVMWHFCLPATVLSPPSLSHVPNNKLCSCIFGKMAKLSEPKQRAARLCKNRLCSSSLLKYGVIMHEKHMWWYLKCVRCLCMSRSRMGVGLEEPRGERSWLNKSWNSLQICLTDRREGMRVYHLSSTQLS